MNITAIDRDRKRYLELLLLADEQESMIDRYINKGDMFIAENDGNIVAACIVTEEGENTYEIKNLAVAPKFQAQGYGRKMIEFVRNHYADRCKILLVGTGNTPATVNFYTNCGFEYSHRIPNFFTLNYDHPIIDGGKLLSDMIYFKMEIK